MINQISVFLENKAGQLAALTKALTDSGLDIRALHIAESTEYGVVRLVVDDYQKAIEMLVNAEFVVSVTKVAAVAVPDSPGGLNRAMDVIVAGNIDIEYMYSMLGKGDGYAYMIFKVADPEGFSALMEKNGLKSVDRV